MTHDLLARHGLRLLGGIFLIVSGLCLAAPTLLLGDMEVGLETPTALAEIRAAYGGSFAGLAALFFLGAQHRAYRSVALGIGTLVLGVFTAARALSLVIDGTPSTLAFANHAAEGVGFLLVLWLWRAEIRSRRTSVERGS